MPEPLGMKLSVRIDGLEELVKKLAEANLQKPARNFFKRATNAIQKAARLRSPYKTGRLQGSIVSRIDTSRLPLWGEVGTGVTHAGESYPLKLELSELTHYRATARAGQPTRGWFSESKEDATEDVRDALDLFGDEVEAAWQR